MFIIAVARRGKNVGGILLLLAVAAEIVCINLNGNCGDVSRPAPSPLFRIPLFPPFLLLEQLTTFRCLLSREALLISRSFYHLFPARAVVDDNFTLSSRKLRINVGHQFAATESSRAYHGRRSRINNFRRRIFLILLQNVISRLRDIKADFTLMHFQ